MLRVVALSAGDRIVCASGGVDLTTSQCGVSRRVYYDDSGIVPSGQAHEIYQGRIGAAQTNHDTATLVHDSVMKRGETDCISDVGVSFSGQQGGHRARKPAWDAGDYSQGGAAHHVGRTGICTMSNKPMCQLAMARHGSKEHGSLAVGGID